MSNSPLQKNRFIDRILVTDKSFYSRALMLLIPVVLQNCINQGVNMMDTIMVGSLGEAAISASSLANQFYSIYNILCMGISAAGLVLAAQYWGAGDVKTVRRVFDLVLQIVLLAGTAFALLTFLFPEAIMSIYTNEADVIAEGAEYLKITALIYLPHGIALVITNVIRAVGNAKLGLYVSIISFFFNIVCNYIFIFGKLGLPAMGVMGAALGTLCARVVELIVCAVYMLKYEKDMKYRPTNLLKLPGRELLGEFKRLGLPAIISDSLLALANSAMSVIIGHMGKEVVSAYAIVTVVDRLCNVASSGVASASGVIVGQTVGQGKFQQAKKEGYTFLVISGVFGIFAALLVLTVGVWSINLYGITDITYAIAVSMMQASAIVVFFQAIQTALSKGILRGGGDTKFLMVADIIFQWCASVPLGYLVGIVLGWHPSIVLLVLRIDFVIKSVWLTLRLRSGKWIHKAKNM